jgi:hypothetical protein
MSKNIYDVLKKEWTIFFMSNYIYRTIAISFYSVSLCLIIFTFTGSSVYFVFKPCKTLLVLLFSFLLFLSGACFFLLLLFDFGDYRVIFFIFSLILPIYVISVLLLCFFYYTPTRNLFSDKLYSSFFFDFIHLYTRSDYLVYAIRRFPSRDMIPLYELDILFSKSKSISSMASWDAILLDYFRAHPLPIPGAPTPLLPPDVVEELFHYLFDEYLFIFLSFLVFRWGLSLP